jgi:hypothetical protein
VKEKEKEKNEKKSKQQKKSTQQKSTEQRLFLPFPEPIICDLRSSFYLQLVTFKQGIEGILNSYCKYGLKKLNEEN